MRGDRAVMAKRKKQKRGTCAVCGRDAVLTRDHIPPQGLFLDPKPDNLIVVGTCATCNNSTRLDDEYFRLMVAVGAHPTESQWRLWSEKVVGSTFKRSPSLRKELVREMDEFYRIGAYKELTFTDGRRVPESVGHLILPLRKNSIDSTLTKIVRCLHYRREGSVLSLGATIDVTIEAIVDRMGVLVGTAADALVGNHGEFGYWRVGNADQSVSWFLLFHLQQLFQVKVSV